MSESSGSATGSLADIVLAVGFVLLLVLAVVPSLRVRQATLTLASAALRIGICGSVVAMLVWTLVPETEPARVTKAMDPMVQVAADRVDCEKDDLKPFLWLAVALSITIAGVVVLNGLDFARAVARHQRLLERLAPKQTQRSAVPANKKLWDLVR